MGNSNARCFQGVIKFHSSVEVLTEEIVYNEQMYDIHPRVLEKLGSWSTVNNCFEEPVNRNKYCMLAESQYGFLRVGHASQMEWHSSEKSISFPIKELWLI